MPWAVMFHAVGVQSTPKGCYIIAQGVTLGTGYRVKKILTGTLKGCYILWRFIHDFPTKNEE